MRRRNDIVWDKIMERPVLPLALFMSCALLMTYLFDSLIPQCVLALMVFLVMLKERDKCGKYIILVILTVFVTLFLGLIMVTRLDITADERFYIGNARIDSIEHRLSGKAVCYVTLDDGDTAVIYADKDPFWDPGSSIDIQGRLRTPPGATNPGQFDLKQYLRRHGINYVLTVSGDPAATDSNLMASLGGYADRLLYDFRKKIYASVSDSMDSDNAHLTAALCLGDPSLMSKEVKSAFNLTSCSHLIAVSGTHFNAMMTVITFVISSLDKKRTKPAALLLCLMIALITGFKESVTRAFVMNICMIMSRDKLSGLSIGVMVMMIADPFAVMSQGLQMSAAGSFGILYFAPPVRRRLILGGVSKAVSDTISASAGAHMGLLPFYGFYGMRLSVFNYLCQLAGGFVVTAICMIFIPVMLLVSFKATFAVYGLEALTGLLSGLVSECSSLSYLSVNCGRYGKYVFVILYAFIFVLFLPDGVVRKILIRPLLAAAALACGFALYRFVFPPAAEVIFLDVGQGDCCLIIAGDHAVMIDGGKPENGEVLTDVLNWYGIDRLDAAVISHWDDDHYGGISYLYREGRTDHILAPVECTLSPSDPDHIGQVEVLRTGSSVNFDGVECDVLWPIAAVDGGNEDSLVMMVTAGGCKILFTGDIGEETERKLISLGSMGDCDILKAAHHGSRYSSCRDFIRSVTPEVCVISCGRHNSYGHPHGEVVEILSENCVNVRRTDLEGAISFEIN